MADLFSLLKPRFADANRNLGAAALALCGRLFRAVGRPCERGARGVLAPAVKNLAESGRLSLDGLITHRSDAMQADSAYRTAFGDPSCLKMILDWRSCS